MPSPTQLNRYLDNFLILKIICEATMVGIKTWSRSKTNKCLNNKPSFTC